MHKQFLADYKSGERIEAYAVVRKIELREYNGSHYLLLELGDRSSRIKAVLWNDSEAVARSLKTGDVAKVVGNVATYKDSPQIRIEAIRKARDDEYNRENIFRGPKAGIEKLLEELDKLIASIHNPFLSQLLNSMLSEKGIFRKSFSAAPGGKLWHHDYRGGLLEHTVSVSKLCRFLGAQYEFVENELLVTGAILHDIGKTVEYNYQTDVVDFSDAGRLKGHIVIGYEIVNKAVSEIPDFPRELGQRLAHMILAHQGKKEFGSPVVPQTMEAMLLYYSDETDSKAGAFSRILTETMRAGKTWSNFVPLMERYLYAGETLKESS